MLKDSIPCSILGHPFGMFCHSSPLLKLSYYLYRNIYNIYIYNNNIVKMELPILFHFFCKNSKYLMLQYSQIK